MAFFQSSSELSYSHQLVFIVLPTVVWAAMSFGVMGSALAVLLPVLIAALATGRGLGPFYTEDAQRGQFQLLLFFFTAVLVELMVVAMQARRKRAEVALQKSELQLRTIIATEPECVKLLAKDGTVLQMNPAGLRMLEADTPGQIIGQKALGIVVPQHRGAFADLMRRVFEGESGNLEFEVVGLKGSHRWLETYEVPMRDAEGRITSMLGITRDITERQRIQKETESLLRRYQTLMKTALDGIRVMDIQGNIIEANDSFCEMLGYTHEEASHLNVADWDVQWSKEELQQRLKDFVGKSARFETVHCRKDGTLLDVEISTTGVEINGQSYFFASSRDITGRKASEEKLQRLMNLYAALTQCNQSIVRCSSDVELYQQVCRDAVRFGGMKMAWIGSVDKTSHRVKPLASFGENTEYLKDIIISAEASEPSGQGPTGTAIREDHPVWIQDFQNDPLLALWRDRDTHSDWAASAALPLQRNGVVIGALNLYSSVANAFDEAARNLLVGMATDISYALTRFALLAERSKTEDAMRIAAVTFETQEAILITDPDGNILRVNQAFQEITGYHAEDVIGQNPRILQSGRHDAAFFQAMWSDLRTTGKWSGELWDRRKDGEIYPKLMTITAVRDDNRQVTHYVAVFRDISNRKKSEDEIHQLAFYDSLTLLPNRRLLIDRLHQAVAASGRNGRHGALLFLDMDHFKTINDTQGHVMGDQLLIEVARRLQTCVRDGDSVARLGGDEFVVVLEGLSSDANEAASQTELVAEKIRSELGRPYLLNDFECLSSASIGISLFLGHLESVEELLMHADVAMYQAKSAGRNSSRFFDPAMQTALDLRAALEADLRHALEKQQFRLYYQIQVDSQNHPMGAELLLRWQHPERGLIAPM
ncbi:MAG: PAS domain S-box protein, partial [Gallionella sp.]